MAKLRFDCRGTGDQITASANVWGSSTNAYKLALLPTASGDRITVGKLLSKKAKAKNKVNVKTISTHVANAV
jgi:hypothetical protein